jgi:hypothetical protein
MITTNFETFAQRSKEMAWTKTPSQKIDGGGVSSQWGGTHTRFEEPKKWHCGSGGDRTGWLNYGTAKDNSACYISACTTDWVSSRTGKQSPARCKMFETFRREAKAGDIIFLHHKKVTHWGKYTGEILSYREGFPNPPDGTNPEGWVASAGESMERLIHQFHIKVEHWIPVSQPFMGAGERATLFEVTNNLIYQDPL